MNNNDTNESLNAIPLGSVNNDESLQPVGINQEQPASNFGMGENGLNSQLETFNSDDSFFGNTSVNYDVPDLINNFNTTPVFNDIGTVPPLQTPSIDPTFTSPEPQKKKGMNKALFVIIIILALFAVGAVVYVLLHKANIQKAPVVTKNVLLEIGTPLSGNINDYATFNGVNSSTCTLDTSGVIDINTLGALYTYNITCNNLTYSGTIKIVDNTTPIVKTKEVTVGVNGSISPESFIESCSDITGCSYKFEDADKIKEYLKAPESYHVTILVTDGASNETKVTGVLIVSESIANLYLVCTKNNDDYIITNKFGIINSAFNKSTTRLYEFKFDSEDEYNTFKDDNKDKSEITYNDITGNPEFNDDNNTLTLTTSVSYDVLNSEVEDTVPLGFGELKSFFQDKDYTCSLGN